MQIFACFSILKVKEIKQYLPVTKRKLTIKTSNAKLNYQHGVSENGLIVSVNRYYDNMVSRNAVIFNC